MSTYDERVFKKKYIDGYSLIVFKEYVEYIRKREGGITKLDESKVCSAIAAAAAKSAAMVAETFAGTAIATVTQTKFCLSLLKNGAKRDVTTLGPVTNKTRLPFGTRVIFCRGTHFGKTGTLIRKTLIRKRKSFTFLIENSQTTEKVYRSFSSRPSPRYSEISVPKRSFFTVISEAAFRRFQETKQNSSVPKWLKDSKHYAFVREKMMNKMTKRDKNKQRLYLMFMILTRLAPAFMFRSKWCIASSLGASLPKKINLYVQNSKGTGYNRRDDYDIDVMVLRVSPSMTVGAFVQSCLKYNTKKNEHLLNLTTSLEGPQNKDKIPYITLTRSTFDVSHGVQNRADTSVLTFFMGKNSNSPTFDWNEFNKRSECDEKTFRWLEKRRLWDTGIRNGDLLEFYFAGKRIQRVRRVFFPNSDVDGEECKNPKPNHKFCPVDESIVTVPKGKLKCYQIEFPEDL